MYSLLEKSIINKKLSNLQTIIYEISTGKIKSTYLNFENNNQEVLIILNIIKDYVKQKDINNAILNLNRAFCTYDNFCIPMIQYMKIKLSNFIKDNIDKFDINDLTSSHIISAKYKNKDNFDYSHYIEDRICVMNKSPDIFIYLISSLSFEINLKLYINQSFGEELLIYNNDSFKNELSVDLIYSNGYYLILYNRQYFSNFKLFNEYNIETDDNVLITFKYNPTSGENINKNEELESNNSQNEINDDSDINNCSDDSRILSKNTSICKNCLIENINKVLLNRLNNLIEDNYDNIEYHTRDIKITDHEQNDKKLILSPLEFKYLYGNNSSIYKELIKLLDKNICSKCKIVLKNESKIKLKCGCKFCKNCIKDILSEEILNKNNLNYFQKIEIKCPNCKKEIDFNSSFNNLYTEEELKVFSEQSNIKKMNSFNILCINCGNKCQNKKNNILEFSDVNDDHFICDICFKNIVEENKKNPKKSIQIKCKICEKTHSIDYSKIKKKVSPSCLAKCIIF